MEERIRRRVLDLAQQGYTIEQISSGLAVDATEVEAGISSLVPGGIALIRRVLGRRVKAFLDAAVGGDPRDLQDAEDHFGAPRILLQRILEETNREELTADEETEAAAEEWAVLAQSFREPDPVPPAPARKPTGRLDAVIIGNTSIDPRALACARSYAMGCTLAELGEVHDVTRERIRQIIEKQTPWSTKELGGAAKALAEQRSEEHRRAVLAWSELSLGRPYEEAIPVLGLSVTQIEKGLGKLLRFHSEPRDAPAKGSPRKPEHEIIEDLQAFNEETGSTVSAAYDKWSRTRPGAVGRQTVMHRFGGWNAALRAAGISDAADIQRERAFSEEDLWAALVSAVEDLKHETSTQAIENWLSTKDSAPSLALIRQRLGVGMAEAIATVFDILADDADLDPDWVADVLRPRDWDAERPTTDPVEVLRLAVADVGADLTMASYREWAVGKRVPAIPTLIRHGGRRTWRELVLEAGGVEPRPKARRWTDAEILDGLRGYLLLNPDGASTQYATWAKPLGMPSMATVCSRFGSWTRARELAEKGPRGTRRRALPAVDTNVRALSASQALRAGRE